MFIQLGLAKLIQNSEIVKSLHDNGLTDMGPLRGLEKANLMTIGLKVGDANRINMTMGQRRKRRDRGKGGGGEREGRREG